MMRLSYTYTKRDIDNASDELSAIVDRNGFTLNAGTIQCKAKENELVAAIFGLVQIQATADGVINRRSAKGIKAEEFRAMVLDALRVIFPDKVQADYQSPDDREGLYRIDAFIDLARPVAVAAVPSDLEAERAIVNKLHVAPQCSKIKSWVAVTKNINSLGVKTRTRLLDAYTATVPELDTNSLRNKITELAA
jgi:hypothetical protein